MRLTDNAPRTAYLMVDKMRREFPERLRALRGDQTLREFADVLGTRYATLAKYETGAHIPPADFLVIVRMATGARTDWLLLGTGKPPPRLRRRGNA